MENLRQKCEIYSRVVGYIRPIDSWNEGKRAEFDDRVNFNINNKTTMSDETLTPLEGETMEIEITAEDLALNEGALEEAGVKEGDIIEIPVPESEEVEEEVAE